MKKLVWVFLFAGTGAWAAECTPEATQKLQALMAKVTDTSKAVDGYKKEYKTDSQSKTDLMVFCLSHKSRPDFKKVFDQAVPAVNDLEEFGNGQTGPCKEAALKASGDLERNVRQIMARIERCKQNM